MVVLAGKGNQQVSVIGSTAYVPQAPFILGGTVRDNILFGREYDEERYGVAVQAAQLEPDLAQLPAGDMTELGESGGGCHHISYVRVASWQQYPSRLERAMLITTLHSA